MSKTDEMNPAEVAAQQAQKKVFDSIENNKSFRFEAGAGAGKTYSLIKTLNYLIEKRGKEFIRTKKKIACITYTNVAKDEIISRTDAHPAVLSETIHSFCWLLIKNYQTELRKLLPTLNDKWIERFADVGKIGNRTINYDLGYPKVEENQVLLYHDDVPLLMSKMLEYTKFRQILKSRFPFLFIDEYQDTNKDFANAIKTHFVETENGPIIGLFGDHWQQIFGSTGCGLLDSDKLTVIGKEANFRSDRVIVNALNRLRPELFQNVVEKDSDGSINIFHTNSWKGQRRTESHWNGDLPAQESHQYLEITKTRLQTNGWDFNPKTTKILMLTYNVLALEQGYNDLTDIYPIDSYINGENEYYNFFGSIIEPFCEAFIKGHYGEMFSLLGNRTPLIKKHKEKVKWKNDIEKLLTARENATIGGIVELLINSQRPRLSVKIEEQEIKLSKLIKIPIEEQTEEDAAFVNKIQKFKSVAYKEIISLYMFIKDLTSFRTKHGVKGAEFENVLVVCGRGWNLYNFGQFLAWLNDGYSPDKKPAFERNRNLFYVACSRPKKRLAIYFSQELSSSAMLSLEKIFGKESIVAL